MSSVETLIEQGKINFKSGNVDKAIKLLKKANELSRDNPLNQSRAYIELARCYLFCDKLDVGLELIEKALSLNLDIGNDVYNIAYDLNIAQKNKSSNSVIKLLKQQGIFIKNDPVNNHPVPSQELHSIEQPNPPLIKKPGKVTAIGGMRLGSGICNILAGIVFCWLFFPIPLIALGIIEIISASNLLKEYPRKPSTFKTIPIFEIIALLTMAGWISVIVGIISLIFLTDYGVKNI